MNAILNQSSGSDAIEERRLQSASSQAILYVEDDETLRSLFANRLAEGLAHIQPASHWGINE